MNRLEDFVDICYHRESGNALEKLGESLRHELSPYLVLQIICDELGRVSVFCMETPFFELICVQLRFDKVYDALDRLYVFRHYVGGWAEEYFHFWQDAIAWQLEFLVEVLIRVNWHFEPFQIKTKSALSKLRKPVILARAR